MAASCRVTDPIPILFNPAAHSLRAGMLRDELAALSPRVRLIETAAPGDAERLARELADDGAPIIVAAGGDGTLNEVVNGIGDRDVTLGVLPVGTMNVLAHELGLPPRDLDAAWRVIEAGSTCAFDVGCANGRRFLQLAGAGLDAQIAAETTPEMKLRLGPLSYLLTTMDVASRPSPIVRVTTPDGTVREGAFVLVGNGRHYGGPVAFFRDARFDDRLLDVLVFGNTGHLDLLRYAHAALFETVADEPDVQYFQASSLRVESDSHLPVELDGEVHGHLPITFSLAPRPLRVLVPAR
jgi:YegS/Rv2252/BmrU family lipid kinase